MTPSAARIVAFASLGVALASAACMPPPPPPAKAVAVGPNGQPITCAPAGPTITVAENVYGGEVVTVVRPDFGFDVVVVDQVEPCLHVGFNAHWERDGTVLGKCPHHEPTRVTSRDGSQTFMVRQFKGADKLSHVAVGYVRYDWEEPAPGLPRAAHPTDVWLQLPNTHADDPGAESNGEVAPTVATFGQLGFFAAWIEDDTVLGVPLGASARPAAAPLDLAPQEVTDLGPPSIGFTPGGHGLVAFTGTTPEGVHAFATPVACTY